MEYTENKSKTADLNPIILIVMLNGNGPNTPLRQRLSYWIKKEDPTIRYSQKPTFIWRPRKVKRKRFAMHIQIERKLE